MHIWEYITFLANTLIFFIVGVVMAERLKGTQNLGKFMSVRLAESKGARYEELGASAGGKIKIIGKTKGNKHREHATMRLIV